MQVQIEQVIREFQSARRRLDSLVADTPREIFLRRPTPESWSAAECVEHLNLTSRAYLPLLRAGLQKALPYRAARYRMDFTGWLLLKAVGKPGRFRTKTAQPFIPRPVDALDPLLEEFRKLQSELIALVESCDGLSIDKVRIATPFAPNIRYSIYSALKIVPAHQNRHLWQAGQATLSAQRKK